MFDPSAFTNDDALISHINLLSQSSSCRSREELTHIAEYIQTQIVEPGTTADHLPLVSAILTAGLPSHTGLANARGSEKSALSLGKITQSLEKTTRQLEKTKSRTRLELAPAYRALWATTLKATYLTRFEQTVRHCYQTLANGKTYPGLGVDKDDPRSLTAARRFLAAHRQTLWILNPRYSIPQSP